MSNSYNINTIGIISSPYKEKFSVPRQPGLVEDGEGILTLLPPYHRAETIKGLVQFSHLWLIFIFHQISPLSHFHPTVRPPRLGGNQRVGIFASRSPFRPNPIGLSLVKLKEIIIEKKTTKLILSGIDLVDQTPIIDIKPYLPYADAIPEAHAGFAQMAPAASIAVIFSTEADKKIRQLTGKYPYLRRFITQLLAQDPRPAYHATTKKKQEYAVKLLDFNIRWRLIDRCFEVFSIEAL